MFSLRIVKVDHYMSSPKSGLDLTYSQFRGAQVKSVPVFRIFGSTASGKKTCLHVHGVFPYILVPYSGGEDAGRLMYQLTSSLDKAINISQNTSHSSRQHVFKIVQVSGRPFYGYHSQDHQFLKIFFYNPLIVKKASDLLQNGAVCGTKFQIHEGHVPFTLQFLIDYNLYGMSFINLKSVVYRKDASPPGVTPGNLPKESCCELIADAVAIDILNRLTIVGVTPGNLPKESCCELEADAVAIDILNRLTIEGELAVNPGLAAIWREEQQRLKRDDLDPSQRPLPLVAMSELLLREKLKGNLKYQGKCKTPLKEQIPYPAETQRTTGSDILDASVLNTHSISSLAFSRPNTAEETTIIDEELVWNLTQNSILSNSLDQSLVMALDNLAAQNEMNAAVTQNVEDDSILGSQILPEQDMFENDISDGELEALNYSLPLDLASDNQSEDDDIMEANKGLKEKIPQLDGIGDFGSVKKSKQNKRRRRVLVENAATESYPMSDGEEILISTDTVKDYDCWPESGKQETLEEIFSDEEPYNSPTNNFEDSCMSVDVGTINVDMIETVLRGDPSFVSGDLASEDVIFQSLDNNDDGSEKKKDQNIDNGKIVDKNSNVDSVPSLNTSLDTTDMLAVSCEELLNTSQLDEILNEDLNKGLEIICEKNPQQELKQDIRFEMLSSFNRSDEDNLSEKMLGTLAEYLHIVDVEDDDGLGGEVIKNLGNVGEDNIEAHPDSCEIKMEDTDLKSYVNNIFYDENQPQKDDKPSAVNDQDSLLESPKENPSHKNSPPRISSKRSPQKSTRNKLCVKWIRRKKCQSVCNWPSFEMSRKEIQKYYSQLEIITNYRLHRNDVEETQPILWFPVRESINVENVGPNISKKSKAKASKTIVNRNTVFNYAQLKKKSKINCKSKDTALARFMNKFNISHSEKLKILSSIVKLKRLTGSEICMYSKNPIIQLSSLSKIKTETNNNTKQLSSGKKSSQNTSKSTKLFSQSGVNSKMQVSIQESAVSRKQKKSFKPADSTKESVKSKVLLVQENTPKISNTAVQKSDSSQKTPSKKSYKVFVDEQQNVEGSSVSNTIPKLYNMQKKIHSGNKKLNFSTYVQCDKVLMKDYKDMVTKLLLQGSETSTNGKDKEKRSNNNMDKPGNPLKAESITSCEDNIAVPRKDQSTNLKLDKKCVIKLIPLPVDFESQTKCVNPSTPKTFNRGEYSNDTRNIPKTQTSRLKIDTSLEQLHKENSYYPIVKVEQLVAPPIARKEFETINKATKSNTVSEKYSSSSEDKLKSLKQSSGGSRKRPLRIYSLDGAADNSSSDENLEEKEGNSKLQEILPLYCTPNKRRKSKSCRSPRNYVPLDIEIKKSPKAKPKNKIIEAVEHAVAGSSSEDSAQGVTLHERRYLYTQDSSQEKQASLNCHEKSEFLEPLVSIEILPSTLESRSDNNLTDNSLPSTSTSTVAVKPLKVFVKRLSVDTLGHSLEHERVSQLRRRFHRSSSLPTTSEEKTSYSNKIGHKSICRSKEVNLVESCNKDDQINATSTDRGTKVKKALVFLGKGEQSSHNTASTSVPRRIHISERKLSTDIFDTNSTPESPPVLSNHSESSSDFLRLSGFTKSNTPDHKEDVLISQSPLNNKMLSPDFSGCGSENTSFIDINRNPHRLHNPTLYTPALIPPSRSEVLAKLGEFGLPEVVNEEPFYSDPADVPKAMEVGSTLLKLQSKSVIHMEEFEGVFDSLSKWKKEVLNKKTGNTVYNSCPNASRSNRTLVITPLKPPPTRIQAKEWLKSKIVKKTLEVAEVKKITKITLPSSPGNSADDDDDTMDDSMTISQCTPLSKASDASIVQTQETPEITVSRTSNISPLMASTPVNNQLKLSAAKRGFSRPSSGFRQSLPLIEEENHSNLEEGRYHHQDVLNLQTYLASDSAKQLSDSGVRRLLSESNSSASTSLQIDMVTPNNSGNYRMQLENLQDVKLVQEHQFLTILSMELHVHTRGVLRPNPQHDAISCVFYNITNDCPDPSISNITGAIYVSNDGKEEKMPQFQCEFRAVADEPSLIAAFVALVRKWDPDIFVGYETELMSWGYLLQRAYMLNLNLVAELSRVSRPLEGEKNEVGDEDSEIRLTGRIVLNLWRFLRHEVALQSYTFENMVYHILHQRVPLFSFRTLTSWWSHRTKLYRWLVFEHYITRVEGIAKLMRHVDLVGRTSEFARLFGIQFYEVLSRGSQFRVESMMLRLVKPLNYVAVSPSVQQRAKMRAPESLPLIMEPQSRFYTDPVIVLDFQSLYPSIIIAYNYCYSTCLGRVEYLGRSELFEFGCTQLRVPVSELVKLEGGLNFSPCGVAYVNQSVVRGVLPRMLQEILNTRLMVKQSMKENKENKTLQRVLHNRQLGLKLIANVTYGYTAANFSGRMPCIELGDSVVSKARETLERAINLVSNNKQWGAQVIYGDTDSMFVLVPGKSRQEAFRIGAEIAEAVTNDNPQPVKLKLEKVYQPCLLQTKKRYVGYMYESPSQEQPVYDAKGIETVRRDGCPAVAKMLEKSLRLLFETKDVSLVKRYVCRQFTKVLSGKISVQDLTFAREYRGAAGYRPGACVPALELAKQGCAVDPRSEPRVGERVPYVVVAGAPGLPLIRLVRPPSALLQDPGLRVNAEYYITRVIAPPINRCLSLLGAQVLTWYSELPRKQQLYLPNMEAARVAGRKATISQYFATCGCVLCGSMTTRGVCDQCLLRPQQLSVSLASQVLGWERRVALATKICQSCCGRMYETDCTSLDCPVLHRLYKARRDLKQADYIRSLQQEFLAF